MYVKKNALPIWFGMLFILLGVYAIIEDIQVILLSLNNKVWDVAMNTIGWNSGIKNYDYGVFATHLLFISIGVFIIFNRDRKIPRSEGD